MSLNFYMLILRGVITYFISLNVKKIQNKKLLELRSFIPRTWGKIDLTTLSVPSHQSKKHKIPEKNIVRTSL